MLRQDFLTDFTESAMVSNRFVSAMLLFLRGGALGVLTGLTLSAITLATDAQLVSATQMDPFRLRGGTWGGPCSDWKNDTAPWKDVTGDGVPEPFSYWWSGHPRFWNQASADGCWHSDETTPQGDPYRPGVDYTGSAGTTVYFVTEHFNSSTYWPGPLFESTGCSGLQARVYAPNGVYMSLVHYWHTTALANVIGTNWTYHYDVPGDDIAYRNIATIASSDPLCTTTGPHVHQSADDPTGGSLANRAGPVTGVTELWLRWSLP
jgi:hypothetical protein